MLQSRLPAIALVAAAIAFGVSVAVAQTGQPSAAPPPARDMGGPPQNLQVFPTDISHQRLIANMRFFAASLGVRCTFCHVGVPGQQPDFASDQKPEKRTARAMLRMVDEINIRDFKVPGGFVQGGFENAKVTCFTCHRGSPKPLTMPPPEPAGAPPAPAAPAHAERG